MLQNLVLTLRGIYHISMSVTKRISMNDMKIQLTEHQQKAFDVIKTCLTDDTTQVMILKGYAGTGKTTLLSLVADFLRDNHLNFQLAAPTGRAAKVLRDKIGSVGISYVDEHGNKVSSEVSGQTLHRTIYSRDLKCIEIENEDKSKKSFRFVFPVRSASASIHALIVDESSMVSDMINSTEFFVFGSGRLLTDVIAYARQSGISKMLFVGDDAQLPPVGDKNSQALNEDYFRGMGFNTRVVEMTEVVRQAGESGILRAANYIRGILGEDSRNRQSFVIEDNGDDIIDITNSNAAEQYTDMFPVPEVGNSAFVCFSNRRSYEMNKAIREILFPDMAKETIGDILLICSNSYDVFGCEMFNGDMVKVVGVGEEEVHRNVPVTHKGEKRHVDLVFRPVEIMYPNSNKVVNCIILRNMIDTPERDISVWEQKALYIDFCIRNSKLKEGTGEFKKMLVSDPYFNALKVKFGYAMTCHKSQGGEWDVAFVDYSGRCGLFDDALRWCYTATTRAKRQLRIINPPHITFVSNLKFSDITKVSKLPSGFWRNDASCMSPFHTTDTQLPLRLKCMGIIEAVRNTPFRLANVQSLNYRERYDFEYHGEHLFIDALYDGSGTFKPLQTVGDGSPKDQLANIVNNAFLVPQHAPVCFGDENLDNVYQRVYAAADEVGLRITNVVNDAVHFFILFCFYSPEACSVIQFYLSRGKLSTALPKSTMGKDDVRLVELIKKIM